MEKQYGCICADPPWTFYTRSVIWDERSAQHHYPTMSLDDIKALPVQSYAAKDCVLFLWVTDTHLDRAFEVIDAWGFTFKTLGFNWIKTHRKSGKLITGCGWWSRAGSEMCLLATRGRPKPGARDVKRVVVSPIREHSRKPDAIYETHIPRLVSGPYLELFARTRRVGWDVAMSDEPDKFPSTPPLDQIFHFA